jgi:hypothetical protein
LDSWAQGSVHDDGGVVHVHAHLCLLRRDRESLMSYSTMMASP